MNKSRIYFYTIVILLSLLILGYSYFEKNSPYGMMELYSTQLLATLPSSCEGVGCEKIEWYWDGKDTCSIQKVIGKTNNENTITTVSELKENTIEERIKEKGSGKYIFNKESYDSFEKICL